MKNVLLTLTAAFALTASTAFATAPQTVQITDGAYTSYGVLNTGGQYALAVPLADLGGAVPADLTIATSGLPDGTTLTLQGVGEFNGDALLWVTATRSNPVQAVSANAQVAVMSGGQTLATFSVPVFGASLRQ